MNVSDKIESIERDIQNGLRYKAADRLRNLINQYPNDLELWNRLAELYYDSGFIDAAGRYWILTEPTDERIKSSVEKYEKSVNYSGYQILQEITFRGDKSKLPDYARNKLNELEKDSKAKVKHIPKFKPKLSKNRNKRNYQRTTRDKISDALVIFIFIAIPVLIIFGIIKVIELIF